MHLFFHSSVLGYSHHKSRLLGRDYFGSALAEMLLVSQFKIVPKKKTGPSSKYGLLVDYFTRFIHLTLKRKRQKVSFDCHHHHYPLPPLPLALSKK